MSIIASWNIVRPHLCSAASMAPLSSNPLRGFVIAAAFVVQVSNASAAEFLTTSDIPISGEIVSFSTNSIAIRSDIGALTNLALSNLSLIRYEMNDGSLIEGSLDAWSDGVYIIDVEGKPVRVKNGSIAQEETIVKFEQPEVQDEVKTAKIRASENLAPTTITEDARTKLGASIEATSESTAAFDRPEAQLQLETVEIALAGITTDGRIEVFADVEATSESASTMVFDIGLSEEAKDDIVLLYATVDGAAKAGLDYVASNGVLVLPAGTSSTQLETELIDDHEAEDDEDFSLFLSFSSAIATTEHNRVSATIVDDDS